VYPFSCNSEGDSYYLTQDLSGTVKLPWNGKVTIGVNNLTNEYPRLDQLAFTPPYYNRNLYNDFGREIYFRYTQNW
jgi:iron complex outermembrane receptor protein